jgi:hypothetical protein
MYRFGKDKDLGSTIPFRVLDDLRDILTVVVLGRAHSQSMPPTVPVIGFVGINHVRGLTFRCGFSNECRVSS